METNPKKQRQHFYRDYTSGQSSMSELCDRYQIIGATHRDAGTWVTARCRIGNF